MPDSNSTKNANDHVLREQLIELLRKGNAHVTLEDALQDLPEAFRGIRLAKLPYSIWQVVEHIRIAQWDILEFSRNTQHKSPKWPEEYWPAEAAPTSDNDWKKSLAQIQQNKQDFIDLLHDLVNDLYLPFPHGDGQNLLREAFLIADHTSYHTGQIIILRRLLDAW